MIVGAIIGIAAPSLSLQQRAGGRGVWPHSPPLTAPRHTLLHRHGVLALNHSARFPIRTYPLETRLSLITPCGTLHPAATRA